MSLNMSVAITLATLRCVDFNTQNSLASAVLEILGVCPYILKLSRL